MRGRRRRFCVAMTCAVATACTACAAPNAEMAALSGSPTAAPAPRAPDTGPGLSPTATSGPGAGGGSRTGVGAPTGPDAPARGAAPADVDCKREKCIAITFDDGPGEHTARLLDMLEKDGGPSTFFVLGMNAAEHPDLLKRMIADGHEIANHTHSHVNLQGQSAAGIQAQIRKTQRIVERAAGVQPKVMRPPYGATDKRVGRHVNLPQIMWKGDTLDWRDKNARLIARRVLKLASRNAVILLHDIHKSSVDAMPRILEKLDDRGYRLVTVSQLHAGKKLKPGRRYDLK